MSSERVDATLPPVMESIAAARGAWERRKLTVIERDCPTCTIDSMGALTCGFRGQLTRGKVV